MRPNLSLIIIAALLLTVSADLHAGKLSDFEKDTTPYPESSSEREQYSSAPRHKHHHRQHERDNDDFFSILFGDLIDDIVGEVLGGAAQAIGNGLDDAATHSNQRINDSSASAPEDKRTLGEPVIPYFRLNLNLQNIESNIYGFDGKLELGYGAIAGEYRQTRYRDDVLNEHLLLKQLQIYSRMSFGNHFVMNFGLGAASLDGENHAQGALFSIPIIYYPQRHLAFELRPSWMFGGNLSLNEMDLSTLISYQRVALRLGYRQLNSQNDSLEGAYAGIEYIF